MSIQTTYTSARANLAKLFSEVTENREIVIIRRRGAEDVAIVAADELASLKETAHLLRSPKNAKRLLARIRGDSPEPPPVCAYRFFRQSMVYYAGYAVQFCDNPEQLQQFLEQTPQAYVITLDKYKTEVEGKRPGRFRVLAHEQRFMATDEMVVFAPAGKSDSSRTARRPQMNTE